jgi:HSF-type DNA-binding
MTFAEKLHHMLSTKQFEKMISWTPHGRAFKVLRPGEFERRVMPTYFGHSRYSGFLSMIRQYGLKHLTKAGPDQGCLYHEVSLSACSRKKE